MRKSYLVCFFLIFFSVFAGCRFFDLAPSSSFFSEQQSERQTTSSLKFKVVIPGQDKSLSHNLRASDTTARVVFCLYLLNLQTPEKPVTVFRKTAEVSDNGLAEVSFGGIPVGTVIGDMSIEGGSIGGYREFHGAMDLGSQNNELEISPRGCLHPSDIVAQSVKQLINDPEIFGLLPDRLVNSMVSYCGHLMISPDKSTYGRVVNDFIEKQINPPGMVSITPSVDSFSISGAGAVTWKKDGGEIFTGSQISGALQVSQVCRPGIGKLGGVVIWNNWGKTSAAITIITPLTGSVQAILSSDGHIDQIFPLSDGRFLLGGGLSGQPMAALWDGKTSVHIGQNRLTGTYSDGLIWVQRFEGLEANVDMPNPEVSFLECTIGENPVVFVQCQEPASQNLVLHRLNFSNGVLQGGNESLPLRLWAQTGNSTTLLGWDNLKTAAGYRLYWNNHDIVTPETNSGSIENPTNPFLHQSQINGQDYYYKLVAFDNAGQAKAESPVVRSSPSSGKGPGIYADIIEKRIQAIVGQSGGSIRLENSDIMMSEAEVIIPAGTLGTAEQFSISRLSSAEVLAGDLPSLGDSARMSPVFSLETTAEGFARPVAIEIPFQLADTGNADELIVLTHSDGQWSKVPDVSFDLGSRKAFFHSSHFSEYWTGKIKVDT